MGAGLHEKVNGVERRELVIVVLDAADKEPPTIIANVLCRTCGIDSSCQMCRFESPARAQARVALIHELVVLPLDDVACLQLSLSSRNGSSVWAISPSQFISNLLPYPGHLILKTRVTTTSTVDSHFNYMYNILL